MVLPIFSAWTDQFEECMECLKQLESNLAYWKAEVQKQEAGKQTSDDPDDSPPSSEAPTPAAKVRAKEKQEASEKEKEKKSRSKSKKHQSGSMDGQQ